MGRSFISVRQRINEMAERWARTSRTLKREEKEYGRKVSDLAKTHASEAFVRCNEPLEGGRVFCWNGVGEKEQGRGNEARPDSLLWIRQSIDVIVRTSSPGFGKRGTGPVAGHPEIFDDKTVIQVQVLWIQREKKKIRSGKKRNHRRSRVAP